MRVLGLPEARCQGGPEGLGKRKAGDQLWRNSDCRDEMAGKAFGGHINVEVGSPGSGGHEKTSQSARKQRVMRQGVAMEGEKFGPNITFSKRFFVFLSPKIQS